MSALVARAQAGDAEAFGLIYDRHVDQVFRFVSGQVRDRQAAEDLTSETFVRALRNIGALRPDGDITAWLTTIARRLTGESPWQSAEVPVAEIRDRAEGSPMADPAKTAVDRLVNAELIAGVNKLSAPQRQYIVLRYLRELSIDEIAVVMGKTPEALKGIQYKALRALRGLLSVGVVMPA
ncbi:sigma-70 family RNA polymerase sigma factor [Micromonospora echinofusca]|uniref:RNA polymerase sigma factor n=1 Tax=Micromonospora TaxID=1873 RepID=UPI0033217143